MSYILIQNQDQLRDLAARIQQDSPDSLPLDLEFVRRETYYPQLSLIQLLFDKRAYIIDCQAEGIDIEPLRPILENHKIIKIFHSGRQDIEIFFNILRCIPHPLFDTQTAEMFLSPLENQAYHTLVQKYMGVELDKSQQTGDWGKRPLSDRAYRYAADDVVYLADVYKHQTDKLQSLGFLAWVQEDMRDLEDEKVYISDPWKAWKKVKMGGQPPSRFFLGRLRLLAKAREEIAAKTDRPKTRILKDPDLVKFAKQENNDGVLKAYKSFKNYINLGDLKNQLEHLKIDDCPSFPEPPPNKEQFQKRMGVLKEKRDKLAESLGLCPTLLATNKDLEALAAGKDSNTRLSDGWRKTVWG